MKRTVLFTALFLLSCSSTGLAKQVIGFIEPVKLTPPGIVYPAKIDSGARSSSLHATDIRIYNKNGEQWVEFNLWDAGGKPIFMALKLVRIATIKRHKTASQKRPVVMLGMCVDKVYRETRVNLIDRSKFKYRLLVGRDYLSGQFLIDTEVEKTTSPKCRER